MKNRFSILACYDVDTTDSPGRARLRRMAKACEAYGQRVQYSVFELDLTPALLQKFLARATDIMDPATDSLRVYTLSGARSEYLKTFGRDGWVDFLAPLIIQDEPYVMTF